MRYQAQKQRQYGDIFKIQGYMGAEVVVTSPELCRCGAGRLAHLLQGVCLECSSLVAGSPQVAVGVPGVPACTVPPFCKPHAQPRAVGWDLHDAGHSCQQPALLVPGPGL